MYLRGDILRRLDAYGGVPFPWWQDSHLVQELIYPSQQVTSVFCLVRYIMEYLVQREVKDRRNLTW